MVGENVMIHSLDQMDIYNVTQEPGNQTLRSN
jgi:hypothetical protein